MSCIISRAGIFSGGRTGVHDHKVGEVLQQKWKIVSSNGNVAADGNGYPITSETIFPVSEHSVFHIEVNIGANTSTDGGRPLAIGAIRWSKDGAAMEALNDKNDWGERTPNFDGNDRSQVNYDEWHRNVSFAKRTYAFHIRTEQQWQWHSGTNAPWGAGSPMMCVTEYQCPFNDTATGGSSHLGIVND